MVPIKENPPLAYPKSVLAHLAMVICFCVLWICLPFSQRKTEILLELEGCAEALQAALDGCTITTKEATRGTTTPSTKPPLATPSTRILQTPTTPMMATVDAPTPPLPYSRLKDDRSRDEATKPHQSTR